MGRKRDIGCVPALLWLVGIVIAVVIAMAIIGGQMPQRNPADRIEQACREQYPSDQEAQNRCRMGLMVRELENRDRERMGDAAQRAGIR